MQVRKFNGGTNEGFLLLCHGCKTQEVGELFVVEGARFRLQLCRSCAIEAWKKLKEMVESGNGTVDNLAG